MAALVAGIAALRTALARWTWKDTRRVVATYATASAALTAAVCVVWAAYLACPEPAVPCSEWISPWEAGGPKYTATDVGVSLLCPLTQAFLWAAEYGPGADAAKVPLPQWAYT